MFRAVRYLFQPAEKIPFTSTISASQNNEICPAFRILDEKGCPLSDSRPKCLSLDLARRMMQAMIKQQVLDSIMPEAQRQGRISFYMTSIGEEAACVGSAAVLNSVDVILAQYREAPALLFRGLTLNEFIAQCLGSQDDRGKGRNMPMHFGSPKLAFHTISSPLCTQLPHAAGIGYSFRVSHQPLVCMCYFGEGAASEGDFHAALNMSATLRSRTIFFCRNNGYAISTPASEQYKGDGISSRGAGYGIPSFRVDGTDTLAVMYITELAREIALRDNTPVLIEAMCYRGGHHSTSDDSTRYRSQREITDKSVDSVSKFARFLESEKWWENAETATYKSSFRSEVLATLSRQEKLPKIHPTELLDDVYDKLPVHLQNQKQELLNHLTKYYK